MSSFVPLPLSILDLMPVAAGDSPSRVLRDSVELARFADDSGYARYWVAEHHNMPSIASSAPEVMIAHLASATSRIRVGAGGIMVPNHNPLHVVEVFKTLEALHPGRIDLGLGRAPGTDPLTSSALQSGRNVNELLGELFAFARRSFPEDHPFASIEPMPSDAPMPPIWMLGSTLGGASIAAKLGLAYAFAGHFQMSEARDAINHYRAHFTPSETLAKPRVMLAVTVVCGESEEHARDLAAPLAVAIAKVSTGRRAPLLSVEDALAYPFTPQERAIVSRFFHGAILAGPKQARDELEQVAKDYEADELMLSTLLPGHSRLQSFQRITRAFR